MNGSVSEKDAAVRLAMARPALACVDAQACAFARAREMSR